MGASSDFGDFLVARGLVGGAAWARVQDVLMEARQGLAGTIAGNSGDTLLSSPARV